MEVLKVKGYYMLVFYLFICHTSCVVLSLLFICSVTDSNLLSVDNNTRSIHENVSLAVLFVRFVDIDRNAFVYLLYFFLQECFIAFYLSVLDVLNLVIDMVFDDIFNSFCA